MVVFYNTRDFDYETVGYDICKIMMKHDISLCKSYIYRLKSSILSRSVELFSVLFRNIMGYVPDINTRDERYEDYFKM